jgi:uncharacterized protein YjgD (DUF1641 family)
LVSYENQNCSKAKKHYTFAERSIESKKNGRFVNVIKAYYATYQPTKNLIFPSDILNKKRNFENNINDCIENDSTIAKRIIEKSNNTLINIINNNRNCDDSNTNSSSQSNSNIYDKINDNINNYNKNNNNNSNNINNYNNNNNNNNNEIFESSKYPGKFFRINKETGASEWI